MYLETRTAITSDWMTIGSPTESESYVRGSPNRTPRCLSSLIENIPHDQRQFLVSLIRVVY